MTKYRKSKDPLTLLQLSRTILKKGDPLSTLRRYYSTVDEPTLRGKLFSILSVDSNASEDEEELFLIHKLI